MHSHGGTKNTNIDALDWLKKFEDLGAGEKLLTSMEKDGNKWLSKSVEERLDAFRKYSVQMMMENV